MLFSHYLPKFFTALFGGLFVILGVYTFDNALLFDRIFVAVLIFTALVCRQNVNVLGVVLILMVQRTLDESAWYFFEHAPLAVTKLTFYLISAAICAKLRHDPLCKLLFVSLLLAGAAESYWLLTAQKPSSIHWLVIALALNLYTRYLIFSRVSVTSKLFPQRAESINLDWHIYKLNALAAVAQLLAIIEYIMRTVFGLAELLIIYSIYPYLMRAIATYAIWIIFQESYKLVLRRVLKA